MQLEVIRHPIYTLIYRDVFTKIANEKMLDEIVSLEDKFQFSSTGKHITIASLQHRNNKIFYIDNEFHNRRRESLFLTQFLKMFRFDPYFRDTMESSHYPMTEFIKTNSSETQISRYGDEGQHYVWHTDKLEGRPRWMTLVYYFFKEPKEWTGGELQITNSPIYDGKSIEDTPEILTIHPENNMAVVFDSSTSHRVLPTNSPKDFNKGRFSANIWIGQK